MNEQIEALRKQYRAPDFGDASFEQLIEYIERLEHGIIELARVRDALYARIDEVVEALGESGGQAQEA